MIFFIHAEKFRFNFFFKAKETVRHINDLMVFETDEKVLLKVSLTVKFYIAMDFVRPKLQL